MIISASRRTDIPAFYAQWFVNRIRAGYCAVPNPFNRNQITHVSLDPVDVDAIIFWTRNPRPLVPYLNELDQRGFKYYFQFTLMDNPRQIDANGPAVDTAIKTFRQLSSTLRDTRRVVWRYDPIVLSSITPVDFHLDMYARIAKQLAGFTTRSIVSIVDAYAKARGRMRQLEQQGINLAAQPELHPDFERLMRGIVQIASSYKLELQSCAEQLALQPFGILPGKCIDDSYLHQLFGLEVTHRKDASQREACGCVQSRDIGMYDTCLFGCSYCYATSSFETARHNHDAHDPQSPSLVGHYDASAPTVKNQEMKQPKLF